MSVRIVGWWAVLMLAGGAVAVAEESPQDLTVWNLASAGWDQPWTKRAHAGGAPDMALLRVQTNFLERELRMNYLFEDEIRSRTRRSLNEVEALVAYGLDRRLMIAVSTRYDDFDRRGRSDEDGTTGAVSARLQLVDTEDSSYSLNLKASAPNRGTGERQTMLSYGLAGFEDLTRPLGLDRVGLYYDVLFDSLVGPGDPGAKRHDVSYDLSVAKTVTRPQTFLLGNLTLFVETLAQSNLDGDHPGRTAWSFTPGTRFDVGGGNWLMAGVDIPVHTEGKPYDAAYRMTYILNF